jgi:hypothetical protein
MLFFYHLVDIDLIQVFVTRVVGVVEGEAEKDLWVAWLIAKGHLVLLLRPMFIEFIHDDGEAEVQAGEMLVRLPLHIVSKQVLFQQCLDEGKPFNYLRSNNLQQPHVNEIIFCLRDSYINATLYYRRIDHTEKVNHPYFFLL